MKAKYDKPIILIVAPGFACHMEEIREMYRATIAANHSHQIQIIGPHQKPSKMDYGLTLSGYEMLGEMCYFEPIAKKIETPAIPLPTSHGTNKNKYLPTVNVEKSEATRLKNRKKRQKSKRKNR